MLKIKKQQQLQWQQLQQSVRGKTSFHSHIQTNFGSKKKKTTICCCYSFYSSLFVLLLPQPFALCFTDFLLLFIYKFSKITIKMLHEVLKSLINSSNSKSSKNIYKANLKFLFQLFCSVLRKFQTE